MTFVLNVVSKWGKIRSFIVLLFATHVTPYFDTFITNMSQCFRHFNYFKIKFVDRHHLGNPSKMDLNVISTYLYYIWRRHVFDNNIIEMCVLELILVFTGFDVVKPDNLDFHSSYMTTKPSSRESRFHVFIFLTYIYIFYIIINNIQGSNFSLFQYNGIHILP